VLDLLGVSRRERADCEHRTLTEFSRHVRGLRVMLTLAFDVRDRLRAVRQASSILSFLSEQPYGSGSSDTRRKAVSRVRSSIAA